MEEKWNMPNGQVGHPYKAEEINQEIGEDPRWKIEERLACLDAKLTEDLRDKKLDIDPWEIIAEIRSALYQSARAGMMHMEAGAKLVARR